MSDLAAVLLSAGYLGVLGYSVWRADLRLQQWIAAKYRVAESSNMPRETSVASAVQLPDDLVAVANLESERWARDNEQALMREKFVELQTTFGKPESETWQGVRRAWGVAEMPD